MNDEYFLHMHIPPAPGNEFMRTFTRMEYVLKASSAFADGGADMVAAAWDRFANSIDTALQNTRSEEVQAAIDSLLSEPARKQMWCAP